MNGRHIGVDPGLRGALALFDRDQLLEVVDMPVVDGQVNPHGIASQLTHWGRIALVTIETQHAMPKQGVSSTFKTGCGYGVLIGVCAALGRPVQHVPAATWTRALKVGADKGTHRRRAMDLYPDLSEMFARVKDDGRADAVLVGLWAAQQHRERGAA